MNCTPKTTTATVTCHQLLQTSAKTTKSQQSDGKVVYAIPSQAAKVWLSPGDKISDKQLGL